MKKPFSLYSIIILCTDILAYYLALFLAYELRLFAERLSFIGMLEFSFGHFLALWWIPLTVIFFQISSGLYWRRPPFWIESGKILRSLILSFMVAFSLVSLGQLNASVSRLLLFLLFAVLYQTLLLLRIVVKSVLSKFPLFQQKRLI